MPEIAHLIRELERGLKEGNNPDLVGEPMSVTDMTPKHVAALEENVRGQIRNTFQRGSTQSVLNQLQNPRFRFLDRIDADLQRQFFDALRARSDRTAIQTGVRHWVNEIPSQVDGHPGAVAYWQAALRSLASQL